MALPSASDFNKYDGTKFNNTDWDQNVDKTVEILAAGNYDLNVNQITAQTYANIPSEKFSTLTAGEDLDAGDVVRISGGQLLKADNTTEAGITDVVGINVQTVTSGNTAEIAYGFYDDFSSLTVGTTYYVGVSGGITSTLPATYQVRLGVAVSTTRINLDIKSKYQSMDLDIEDRLTVDSKTRIRTQHITTNSGGIISWTGITMSHGEQCQLITQGGHITGVLRVSALGVGTPRDFLATYSLWCDSYFPNTGIAVLGQETYASALNVYWTSDDLYVGVVSDGNFWTDRQFTITLHYTGTGLNYVEDPIVT